MTPDEIFKKISENPLLSGVTFSGGEPFSQASALLPLAEKIKAAGLELAAYSGYTFEELTTKNDEDINKLLALLDVLVDGRFVLKQRNLDLKFKGSENQRIINVPKSLSEGKAVLETGPRWNKEE